MSRKSYISLISFLALLVFGAAGIFGQTTAPVSGTVELEKDGARQPVAGALVEIYRVDIKSGGLSAKSGKNGNFNFAGVQLGGEYMLAISATGCSPTVYPKVKAGMDKILITLSPGDGAKLSEADARKMATQASSQGGDGQAELTAEQKKEMAEQEAKNKAILDKNKKIQEGDALARKSNEEGQAALKAENYDLAISKFTEGIDAVPDFIGSTPILIAGKMNALKAKGYKAYKEGTASTDPAVRTAKYEEANKSYNDALVSFAQAIDVIKKAEPATDPAQVKSRNDLKGGLYTIAIELHRLKAIGGVDSSKTADAATVVNDYAAFETDVTKKATALTTLGDIMRLSNEYGKAVEAYKQVLEVKPDAYDVMGPLGLCLYVEGVAVEPNDKAKMQEGLNYMQKYTEMAPVKDTDTAQMKELKLGIKAAVDDLKTRNLTPQKITVPTGKKKG